MIMRTTYVSIILAILLFGCSKDRVFDKGFGSTQEKPASKAGLVSAASSDVTVDPSTQIAVKGIYKLSIGNTGDGLAPQMVFCEGEIELNIMKNMQAQNANAKMISCMGVPAEFSLDMVVPPLPVVEPETGKSSQESDGMIFRGAKVGQYAFEPSRPFLVGPVIQDMSKFKGYHEENNYRATYLAEDGSTANYDGKISLRIIDINQHFKPLEMPDELDSVIKWEMKAEGFKGIDHGASFCFARYEMWWSARPLAIANLVLEDSGSEFAGKMLPDNVKEIMSSTSKYAEALAGKIRIELTLKRVERTE